MCVILGNKKSLCYKYRTSIFRYVKYAYEPYGTVLPYCRTVKSLDRSLQHIDEHYIVEAAARNLPAARLQLDRVPPLLPNTPFRWTAVAAPAPQDVDPDASAKPNVPVTSSAAAARPP